MKTVFILSVLFSFSIKAQSINFDLVYEEEKSNTQCLTVLQDKQNPEYFYVANKAGGLLVYEGSDPSQSNQVLQIPALGNFMTRHVNNLYQVGDYLYLALGNFIGVLSQSPGLAIVNISDPENAYVEDVWVMDPSDPNTALRGAPIVEVKGDYAYLGGTYNGLIILDVSDKNNIEFISQLVPDINFPLPNPPMFQIPAARGLNVINDDLLMLCYDAGGIRMIDISDKENPTQKSQYINTSVPHNQAYNNVVVHGDIAFVAVDYCGLEILNISDSENITQISWWNPYGCEASPQVWLDADGHTNELVYFEDKGLVFTSAGDAELLVVDVSDIQNPVLADSWGEPENNAVCWGLDANENTIYMGYIIAPESEYTAFTGEWSGIKILQYNTTLGLIEPPSQNDEVIIYPNPSNGKTHLNISSKTPFNKIEVFDNLGKIIDTKLFDNVQETVITELHSGVYHLQIQTGNNLITRKVIIE